MLLVSEDHRSSNTAAVTAPLKVIWYVRRFHLQPHAARVSATAIVVGYVRVSFRALICLSQSNACQKNAHLHQPRNTQASARPSVGLHVPALASCWMYRLSRPSLTGKAH